MIRRVMVAVSMFVMMVAGAAQLRAADTYKIDPIHATVIYRISHFGVGNAYGRFNEPTGSVTIDNEDPSKSAFEFKVEVDKIDTANPKRDAHLKSPDFFNAKQFPTIEFKSTKVDKKGDNQFELTGDLSMHGVTKPITFVITKTGEGKHPQKGVPLTGWEAHVDLKRSDWGIKGLANAIGDDVHLTISFEAIKQ
jgi:polyisoprenoid-binding protein YceI